MAITNSNAIGRYATGRHRTPNLLRLVVRGVGGVAALVVAVVALDAVVVHGLVDHHHLGKDFDALSSA